MTFPEFLEASGMIVCTTSVSVHCEVCAYEVAYIHPINQTIFAMEICIFFIVSRD